MESDAKFDLKLPLQFRKISRSTCTNNLIGDQNSAAALRASVQLQTHHLQTIILRALSGCALLCQGRCWYSQTKAIASTKKMKFFNKRLRINKRNKEIMTIFFYFTFIKKKLYNFTKYSLLYIYLKLLTLGNDHYNYPKLYIQKLIILKCNDLNLLSILVCLFNIPSKARPK